MLRRVALLGLLSVTACTVEEVPGPGGGDPTPVNKGTVSGILTPFRFQSTSAMPLPAPLKEASVRQRLSARLKQAIATQRAVRSAGLSASTPQADDAVPGEVVIRLEETGLSGEEILPRVQMPGHRATYKGPITAHLHLIGYEPLYPGIMRVREPAELASHVEGAGGVSYAERNVRFHPLVTPTDPGYARQWHYRMMNLPDAWDLSQGSDSIAIGVIDTGIVAHPDLDGRVVQGVDVISDPLSAGDGDGRDMDPLDMGKDQPNGSSSWHGSHVAGTIGAETNEGRGVAGVTWRGPIVPVRALGREGGSFADLAAGIQWAVGLPVSGLPLNPNPVKVINMSLGGVMSPSRALQEVIDDAVNRGVVIVVAAGNSNVNANSFSPCNQNNIICVGATRFNGQRASYSNHGANVDVMATGGELAEDLDGDGRPDGVLSTIVDERGSPVWAYYQGTSMASPHVAGIVALMKAVRPQLTPAAVKQILQATADSTSQCSEGCGVGLVNAYAAVLTAKEGPNPNAPPRLGVGATRISFMGTSTQSLPVRNLGGGSLKVTAKASGVVASALSFPGGTTATVPAYSTFQLPVAVDASRLTDGEYSAGILLTDEVGRSLSVEVRIQVGTLDDKDIILAFLFEGEDGELDIEQEGFVLVPASRGYTYRLALTPRTYYVIATIDEDGDEELFEDGERVGAWRDAANIDAIQLTRGQTVNGINFALVPTETSPE